MTHDKRHDEVFQCIVESYIDTAAPVGSRAVSKRYSGNLSPATIRNVMVDLEEAGLIEQPHTSAGRVPTDKGYRYYVNTLMPQAETPAKDFSGVVEAALKEIRNIEDAAERMSRLIADLTHNAGLLYLKGVRRISYFDPSTTLRVIPSEPGESRDDELRRQAQEMAERLHVEPNDRVYLDGTRNIFEQPEFQDAGRIRGLIRALELKADVMDFLQKDMQGHDVRIYIGREVPFAELQGVSVVVKEYSIDGVPIGSLGVIGPTRMRYDRVASVVDQMADAMTEFLNDDL